MQRPLSLWPAVRPGPDPLTRRSPEECFDLRFPYGTCYELPVIQRRNRLARVFINEGMRAGIPDPVSRARTVTLYLDKPAFRQALDMPDEEHIYVLAVDRAGQVLWRERGRYSEGKGAVLVELLEGRGAARAASPD